MKARMDFRKVSPQGANAISQLHAFVHDCGLDHTLLELVKLRASQINGCAHCIDMHVKELRAMGEREERIHLVAVLDEATLFAARQGQRLAPARSELKEASPTRFLRTRDRA